jgi:Tetratricopeptide repeat
MNNLANVYDAHGKYAEAEALHSQTFDIAWRLLGSGRGNG